MPQRLQFTTSSIDPALLDLPWELPLEEWPSDVLVALPRGISRHVVRFVNLSGRVIAVKEISAEVALREYELLRSFDKVDIPSVQPVAVVTGRSDASGEELNSALVTQHLQYSLPYRALFSHSMSPPTVGRLIDALAVLLVRVHLQGFFWGDVSLSNTLFRRDAGAFAAYVVDAETGELHKTLTAGQRMYDIDIARVNIIGELFDLQAGGVVAEDADVIAVGDQLVKRYEELWDAVTAATTIESWERWRLTERINQLNELGFHVDELEITTEDDSAHLRIKPKVVDAGHYHRKMMRLTGLDVEENQAKRMLNDMNEYRIIAGKSELPPELVAHDWITEIYQPTVDSIPRELRDRLDTPQLFHEILEHRWYLSQNSQRDVPTEEAVRSYVDGYLRRRRDERILLAQNDTQELERITTNHDSAT